MLENILPFCLVICLHGKKVYKFQQIYCTMWMEKMVYEGNQIHNLISSSGSGTVINYGCSSDFLTDYGSGSNSTSQQVTVPTVPVPQRCQQHGSFWVRDTELAAVLRIRDVHPGSWIRIMFHPGYRIHGPKKAPDPGDPQHNDWRWNNNLTPNSRRSLTNSVRLFMTASDSGTLPIRVTALGSAPRSSSTRAIAIVCSEPYSVRHRCSGV